MVSANDNVVGIEALNRCAAHHRRDRMILSSFRSAFAKFVKRCADGTGIAIRITGRWGVETLNVSGGFDLLSWDGEQLLVSGEHPITSKWLGADIYASKRGAQLMIHFDDKYIDLIVTGLPTPAPKPLNVPAPKSDIAGLAAIDANINFLVDAVAKNFEQEYRDTEDMITVSSARDDIAALRAFKAAMTTGFMTINGKGPVALDAAIQWHAKRLYVVGRRLWPEVGNVTFCPVSLTLSIYEYDKDRQTNLQIVAAPEALPLAA